MGSDRWMGGIPWPVGRPRMVAGPRRLAPNDTSWTHARERRVQAPPVLHWPRGPIPRWSLAQVAERALPHHHRQRHCRRGSALSVHLLWIAPAAMVRSALPLPSTHPASATRGTASDQRQHQLLHHLLDLGQRGGHCHAMLASIARPPHTRSRPRHQTSRERGHAWCVEVVAVEVQTGQ